MSNRTHKITCMGLGALLALTAGAPPVLADDTELMLMLPDVSTVRPNILFMLDTSGSMDDEVMTKRPYDPTQTYTGSCDPDTIYWNDVDLVPNCASSQQVAQSAFQCAAASGQLMGIGSYSDTMVQYRETAEGGVSRWQELEAGNSADVVECMADSGVHGAGVAGEVYATNDAASTSGYTSNASRELGWGSAPATVTYTVYDGNYLNWKSTAPTENVKKIDILKAVTTAVLNSISNVNVGVMRFNNNDGGLVIKAVSDLDADRASILQTVAGLPAQGSTPLAEVMYEGAQYWRGGAPHFGLNHAETDPDAIGTGGNYAAPGSQSCSKNFNILLSDGQPVDNTETAPTLAATLGIASCDDSGVGACLDDIAGFLATTDIDGNANNGDQLVTTHTIGFAEDIPSLRRTANDSGGRYFQADDVETLTSALLNIFADITKRSLSFTAPAISVNSFNRTQNLNDLYITVFAAEPNVHWPGNLKKYRVAGGEIVDATGQAAVEPTTGFFRAGAQSIWTDGNPDGADVHAGGAAHELPDPPSGRELWTNSSSGTLVTVDSTNVSAADLGLTGATGEPSLADLLAWMRGQDIQDEDLDNATTDPRNVMGDPLHSQPAAVVYGGSTASPEVVVFVGTNDGYLHAFGGDTGEELWAFVPHELLGDMNRLFFDPRSNFKHYGIDGSIVPVVFDKDNDGNIESSDGDFVYLVFGMRRGGSSYYALDVTNKTSPSLLWVKQYPEFGQSWSTPVIARVDTDDSDSTGTDIRIRDAVVIVGGGYDSVHDTPAAPAGDDGLGVGIHMLDLQTGNRIWWAGPDTSSANLKFTNMNRSFPSQIRVIDMSGDGFADRMYAADVGGRIWRFDITNGQSPASLVAGGVIADLGDEGSSAVPRRFYNAPDVAIFNDPLQGRRFISISIGSGYRAHPLNEAANDRFFSIRDADVFNQLGQTAYNNYDVATVNDLEAVTPGSVATIGPEDRGWQFALPGTQAILADSVTFNDSVLFVAFSPEENTTNPCQPSAGRNFLYQVSVVNGDFAVNNLDSPIDTDPTDHVTEIAQGGIAPTPAVLFPASTDPDCEGAECAPPPIYCIGAECFNSGFANNPVRTLWTQDGVE